MENNMTLQRLYNIAQTGQTAEPTAVDNIMAQYQPKPKQEQGGFWNGFKNFAGSDVGRMLIGGLGTAAAVGLSGGSGKDALRYGLMGAGSTMQSIDSRNRYRDKLMKEQQDRADKLAEAEKLRQHQLTMQANNIQANKDAADLEFERRMEAIREGRDYAEQQKANDKQLKIDAINSNPYLSDEQKAWQISQIDIPEFNNDAYYGSMLVRDPNNQEALTYFTNKAKLNSIINPKTPTSAFSQDLRTLTEDYGMPVDKALDYLGKRSIEQEIGLAGGKAEAEARGKTPYTMAIDNNKSRNDLNNDITMAGINHKNNVAMEGLKHNYNVAMEDQRHNNAIAVADNKLKNDMSFETYKRNLPPEKIIEAEYMAQSLQKEGYDVTAGDILNVAYQKDVLGNANTVASTNQTIANTDKTRAEIPFIPQKMATDIAHTKSQTAKNMYDINPVQPGTVVNGVTLTGNKAYDTEALKQKAKNESEREKAELNREVAQRRNAEMMPRVMQSIDRAYKALEDGTGLGQFGGWAFTTDKGGQNRADIKNAQAQINTAMRGLLSELGVGATEMNSAAEANAYRYVLAPDMSEGEIKRVLDNFVADYTSGDLKQSLASWVGENGNSDSDLSSISTDDLMGML